MIHISLLIGLIILSVSLLGFGFLYGLNSYNNKDGEADESLNLTPGEDKQEKNISEGNGEDRGMTEPDLADVEYSPPETEIDHPFEENRELEPDQAGLKPWEKKNTGHVPVRSKNNLKKNFASTDSERETKGSRRSRGGINLPNKDKSYQIIRLVKQIRNSIKMGNEKETDIKLKKLEKLKGKNDPYILKLRSYLHMRKGENESAYQLLERVTKRNTKDLDAGINMAIIEIRTKRYKEAENRLKELGKVFPENTLIQDLAYKLKGSMDHFGSSRIVQSTR